MYRGRSLGTPSPFFVLECVLPCRVRMCVGAGDCWGVAMPGTTEAMFSMFIDSSASMERALSWNLTSCSRSWKQRLVQVAVLVQTTVRPVCGRYRSLSSSNAASLAASISLASLTLTSASLFTTSSSFLLTHAPNAPTSAVGLLAQGRCSALERKEHRKSYQPILSYLISMIMSSGG